MDKLHEHEATFSRLLDQVTDNDQGRADDRQALRLRVMAAFDAAARPLVAPALWKRLFNQGRETMRRPISRLALAAAVGWAAIADRLWLPTQQSTAQAFHLFAAAIARARSAKFRRKTSIEGKETEETVSYYLAPGKTRDETNATIDILDTKAGKRVILKPAEKRAVVVNYNNRPKNCEKPQLMDIFEQMRALLAPTADAREHGFKPLGDKEFDGGRAVGFGRTSVMQSVTLWGDPATGLPVLVEIVWNGSPQNVVTMSHFELNEALDPALFETTPPNGYNVQAVDVDLSQATEATLIEALRMTSDLNNGVFPEKLDGGLVIKHALRDEETLGLDKKTDGPRDAAAAATVQSLTVARGIGFALNLPASADAHYAGKDVKLGQPDYPILWYRPEGAKRYRVIYADLSVEDAGSAPDVAGAVRLGKMQPAEGPDEKPEE